MTNTLADARREFAGNALQRVEVLTGKLEGTVSRVPPRRGKELVDERVGAAQGDADITACFTHSEGTQTTGSDAEAPGAPARTTTISSISSASSSTSTSADQSASKLEPNTCTIDSSLATMTRLHTLISRQKDATQSEEDAADSVHSSLSDLRSFLSKLESLRYTSSGISGLGGYGGASLVSEESIGRDKGGGKWGKDSSGLSKKEKEKKVDEVKEVRKTIGEVKSVLLSARNFPGVKARQCE